MLKDLITELTACIYHPNSSVRFETVVSISLFGKVCKDTNVDLLNVLVPTLLKSVQDSYVPVKLTSERALLHLSRSTRTRRFWRTTCARCRPWTPST